MGANRLHGESREFHASLPKSGLSKQRGENEEGEQEGKGRCRGMGGVGTYLGREVSL